MDKLKLVLLDNGLDYILEALNPIYNKHKVSKKA